MNSEMVTIAKRVDALASRPAARPYTLDQAVKPVALPRTVREMIAWYRAGNRADETSHEYTFRPSLPCVRTRSSTARREVLQEGLLHAGHNYSVDCLAHLPPAAGGLAQDQTGRLLKAVSVTRPCGPAVSLDVPDLLGLAPLVSSAYGLACRRGLEIPIDHPLEDGYWSIRDWWCMELESTGFESDLFFLHQLEEEMNLGEGSSYDWARLPVYAAACYEGLVGVGLLELLETVWNALSGRARLDRVVLPEESFVRVQSADAGDGLRMKMKVRHSPPERILAAEGRLREIVVARAFSRLGDPLWENAFQALDSYRGVSFVRIEGDDSYENISTVDAFEEFLLNAHALGRLRAATDPLLDVLCAYGPERAVDDFWHPMIERLANLPCLVKARSATRPAKPAKPGKSAKFAKSGKSCKNTRRKDR